MKTWSPELFWWMTDSQVLIWSLNKALDRRSVLNQMTIRIDETYSSIILIMTSVSVTRSNKNPLRQGSFWGHDGSDPQGCVWWCHCCQDSHRQRHRVIKGVSLSGCWHSLWLPTLKVFRFTWEVKHTCTSTQVGTAYVWYKTTSTQTWGLDLYVKCKIKYILTFLG